MCDNEVGVVPTHIMCNHWNKDFSLVIFLLLLATIDSRIVGKFSMFCFIVLLYRHLPFTFSGLQL